MNPLLWTVGVVLPWIIVCLFVALGAWIGFQLIHQNGRLLSRLEALESRLDQISVEGARFPVPGPAEHRTPDTGNPAPGTGHPAPALPVGSPAPAFELPDLAGARKRLADFRGRSVLLIFFNPGCGFCTRMAADLAALSIDGANSAPLPLVVTTGEAAENRKLVEEYGIRCPVLLQQGMEVASQYLCNGTPMGYLIDAQGQIASELAIGGPALLALAGDGAAARAAGNGAAPLGGKRGVEESQIARNGLAAGTAAPDFHLPLLNGGELSLSDYRGRPVLLVFSDPNCGPCDQLSPQLEQRYRAGAPAQVLMVSRGEVEANREKASQHGLTFPIVLQRQWEISREYAMFATPIAYLVDEEGVITREVAVGVEPILSLLAEPPAPTNGKGKVPRPDKEAGRKR